MTQVLIAGIPRSGTSWIEKTLACARGAVSIHEPDNENLHALAVRAKRRLGRFPVLEPGESAPTYERLWRRALSGGTPRPQTLRDAVTKRIFPLRTRDSDPAFSPVRIRLAAAMASTTPRHDVPPHVIVKSVHCALALRWIYESFRPRVVIVLRHPFAIIASQLRMQMKDRDARLYMNPSILSRAAEKWGLTLPAASISPVERTAWQVGLLISVLTDAASQYPEWQVVVHEDICSAPVEHFRTLYSDLGLEWTQSAEDFVLLSDQPGMGYKSQRLAAMEVDRWRTSLDIKDRELTQRTLSAFPLVTSRFEGMEQ